MTFSYNSEKTIISQSEKERKTFKMSLKLKLDFNSRELR